MAPSFSVFLRVLFLLLLLISFPDLNIPVSKPLLPPSPFRENPCPLPSLSPTLLSRHNHLPPSLSFSLQGHRLLVSLSPSIFRRSHLAGDGVVNQGALVPNAQAGHEVLVHVRLEVHLVEERKEGGREGCEWCL